jgi:Mycothiol maleylpyruvate isomerase N-terminal domain
VPADDVRAALIRQWELIADIVDDLDLSLASRCVGWTNREVLAHLYVQPHLVARFLQTQSTNGTMLGVAENLMGTGTYSELIDTTARSGAAMNKVMLRAPLNEVRSLVLAAHLDTQIMTMQGGISVSDYLATRCVEAVVHGGDLVPPLAPDPVAQNITSDALLDTLRASSPELVLEAQNLPIGHWIDLATGRTRTTGPLSAVLPVMA